MKADQLSIFLENRAGRLAEVTKSLSDAGINIRALSLADTSDFGILRLIVSDFEKARQVLKEKGFTVGRTSVVAVAVPDRPGGLHELLELFGKNGINVEYMYAFVQQSGTNATIIFRFDRTEQAIELLQANNITIIPSQKLYSM
ncbi:ACT domain protein [Desulfocurvibacter africanus PCS]|uniref:ACT domain protein n=1 Tax=Desulfocurvibacter africanus PCS TaxID=1262666 RepID=M5PU45_DESAF|nr:ACT domain-containing protein [Desulfocurvibacter africanus]EMG37594.1 ACT domain protein [Desulfocurvibacter africanus PCS]